MTPIHGRDALAQPSPVSMRPRMITTSIAADFFTVSMLETQTGFGKDWFPDVVLKELLDNALDACETAGVAPRVAIDVDARHGMIAITVTDNGGGIDPDVVARIVDFTTRTSDKAVYRKPSRGAQGNAVKSLLGIVTALGGDQPLVIESRGVRHELSARMRSGGFVEVIHEPTPCERTQGTLVRAAFARNALVLDAHAWVSGFALINPHATLTVSEWEESSHFEEDEDGGNRESGWTQRTTFYQPTVSFPDTWRKFVPTDGAAPHWYTPETMRLLVEAYIASDRELGIDTLVRDVVREFRGLTSNPKAAAIMKTVPGIRRMADLDDRPELVATLHAAMIAATTPAKPAVLGSIGRSHFATRLGADPDRFWYHAVSGLTASDQPFVVEVAVAATEGPGAIIYGMNFSPTPNQTDPFARFWLGGEKLNGRGVAGYLANAHVRTGSRYGDGDSIPAIVTVHLTAPGLSFSERGKATLATLPPEIIAGLSTALDKTTKVLHAEGERRRRDRAGAARREEAQRKARARGEREQRWSLKDAVFHVIRDAYAFATGDGQRPVGARGLFYQIRERIQVLTTDELTAHYCTQDLIPEFERLYGKLPRLYYEPRGALHEPHSGVTLPLGTVEVAEYTVPSYVYERILFIEKTGLYPVLADAQLGERFDMAIIASNGFSPVACRELLERATRAHGCQVFVLHDADASGYNICRTLAEETRRMPDHRIDVIDLGLTFEDGLALGISPETHTRLAALPEELESRLTPRERAAFVGKSDGVTRKGKRRWLCERIELNALSSPQLIAYIENGLIANGATAKIVPIDGILQQEATEAANALLAKMAREEIERRLGIDGLVSRFLHGEVGQRLVHEAISGVTEDGVRERLEASRTEWWKTTVGQMSEAPILGAQQEIIGAIETMLATDA